MTIIHTHHGEEGDIGGYGGPDWVLRRWRMCRRKWVATATMVAQIESFDDYDCVEETWK